MCKHAVEELQENQLWSSVLFHSLPHEQQQITDFCFVNKGAHLKSVVSYIFQEYSRRSNDSDLDLLPWRRSREARDSSYFKILIQVAQSCAVLVASCIVMMSDLRPPLFHPDIVFMVFNEATTTKLMSLDIIARLQPGLLHVLITCRQMYCPVQCDRAVYCLSVCPSVCLQCLLQLLQQQRRPSDKP